MSSEFAISLDRFGEVTEQQATTIFRKVTLELDQRIVLSTPVDTGRARGNWYPSLNVPSAQVSNEMFDPSGAKAIAESQRVAQSAKLGDILWLSNNLPYILPLENGHSKQAPSGMVEPNIAQIAAFYGGK